MEKQNLVVNQTMSKLLKMAKKIIKSLIYFSFHKSTVISSQMYFLKDQLFLKWTPKKNQVIRLNLTVPIIIISKSTHTKRQQNIIHQISKQDKKRLVHYIPQNLWTTSSYKTHLGQECGYLEFPLLKVRV